MVKRISRLWLVIAAVLVIAAAVAGLAFPGRALSLFFLVNQDLPVLAAIVCVAAALRIEPGLAARAMPALRAVAATPAFQKLASPRRPWIAALVLAALCAAVGWAGTWLVLDNYALSVDEFMANFDAVILAHGRLMAPIAPAWRDFADALEPQFMFRSAGDGFWRSSYLPVNAALRAVAGAVGGESAVNPLLAAISVLAVFAIARRLWPERPGLALGAAVLLATSSQLLITSMTSYAMTSHLTFNLVWLWLFLRGDRPGHIGAVLVGFLACGLHQLVFHPLFAGPFILELWLARRWRSGVFYTLAYAAICLFWVSYGAVALDLTGVAAAAGAAGAGAGASHYAWETEALLGAFRPAGFGMMAENLVRFVTWQNPLTAPLALMAIAGAIRAKGTLRALSLGLLLTTLSAFVILAYQGHGWGYRYLHGLLGSACLLAAWQWGRLTHALAAPERAVSAVAFAVLATVSALVLAPIRAWQAHSFEHPYAAAYAAIRRSPSQVVLVDDTGAWFTADLVRNEPYLSNRPMVLRLTSLSDDDIGDLCSRFTISVFSPSDASRFGIRTGRDPSSADAARTRDALHKRSCGAPAAPVGEIRGLD